MSNKLRIYGCTGINDNKDVRFDYWLDNTKTVTNTQAINRLLALINYDYVQVMYFRSLSQEERIELLNEIDLLSVCLYYTKENVNNPEELHRCGVVIGALVKKGFFKYSSFDNTERDAHLDELFDKIAGLMGDEYSPNEEFMKWWKTTVEDAMKVGFTPEEQKNITEALQVKQVSGASEQTIFDDPDIGKYMSDAGTYFLYTYFTEAQLAKLPSHNKRIFSRKAMTQNALKSYCESVFIQKGYGDRKYLEVLIRTGIIKDFGKDPESVCEDISNGKETKKVGELVLATTITIADIIAIISAVLSFLATVIGFICQAVAKVKVAKYEALNEQAVMDATPNPEDYEGLAVGTEKVSSYFWIGGAVIAAILLFRR